ncbi:hypothetical protein V5O48_006622 [Marasmius crinis-equi]|uniref:Uncharacterized protein n=1 Tax=Marasmius crinis-equi TaxID=585013 RepID=A0ABR3FJC9_9AGAR
MAFLPRLEQITATEGEDPLETLYLCPLKYQPLVDKLEYFMGHGFGELELDNPSNRFHLRSSMKKLLEENEWTLIPTEEVLKIACKFHEENLNRKVHDRQFYLEVLPNQEYEYEILPLGMKSTLFVISEDGTRHPYEPPYANLPRFRSRVHPLFAAKSTEKRLFNAIARGVKVRNSYIMHLSSLWIHTPMFWRRTPNWKKLGHPLDELDLDGDTEYERFPGPTQSAPAIISQLPASSSLAHDDTTLSATDTACSIAPKNPMESVGNPALLEAYVVDMYGKPEFDAEFDELTNDKQVKAYRKERGRSYHEVMSSGRVVSPLALYFKKEYRYSPYIRESTKR